MENNIAKLDSKNVFASIAHFPNQCENAWKQESYVSRDISIKNILIIGMGGSALGAYILDSLHILNVPMVISHEYSIPSWVDKSTLVFAISYSGTTEETISATEEAFVKGAYVVGITTDGDNPLRKILDGKKAPICTINKSDNPCGQPRYAVGSMMMKILKVCIAQNLCSLNEGDVTKAIKELTEWQKSFVSSNHIEQIYDEVKDLENKMPVLIHGEHLTNLGRFVRNQIHETGKAFAVTHDIPELNHHLMEGLEYPLDNVKNVRVLFFESNLYGDRIKKRFKITKDVLSKQNIIYKSINIDGETPFAQILIGMLRGQYMAFGLALIHEKDPSETMWVRYFKEQLNQ